MDYNFQLDVASAEYVLTRCRPTLVPLHVSVETSLRRAHLAALVRRSRAAARQVATLEVVMGPVGTCSTFCWPQRGRRRWRTPHDPAGRHGFERTPALAPG
jgi:hypothetical protein